MARPETLLPGNCYFSLNFYDNDLVLPRIDTLVYVGQETDEDFHTLSADVAKFIKSAECLSLTMAIRFTDDALALGRREGGYDMGFFAHPRRHPGEASRVLSLFAGIGVKPLVDYVCDRGRTRVLQFPVPGERDAIVALCKRVFVELYSMRRGDVLDYHFLRTSDLTRDQ